MIALPLVLRSRSATKYCENFLFLGGGCVLVFGSESFRVSFTACVWRWIQCTINLQSTLIESCLVDQSSQSSQIRTTLPNISSPQRSRKWLDHLSAWNGRIIMTEKPSLVIESDASTLGWGAFLWRDTNRWPLVSRGETVAYQLPGSSSSLRSMQY